MRQRIMIFGAGQIGIQLYHQIKNEADVIGFIDNDANKWGQAIEDIKVLGGVSSIHQYNYDTIYICSLMASETIKSELIRCGIDENKIVIDLSAKISTESRKIFLKEIASQIKEKFGSEIKEYAVAEGGVFQGDFSKEINRSFPNCKLYLFDTFEGFDERDCIVEKNMGLSEVKANTLSMTNEEIVINKLMYPDMVVIKKGYFPETAQNIDEKFVFVNLDFDLYKPLLEGLRFFYPMMASGGVILVHDYFSTYYKGAREAVEKYESEQGKLIKMPIGDGFSIAILKI